MMKRILFGAALSILAFGAQAQTDANDPTLMTVANQPVSRSEFESIYKKNNKDAPVTKEALDEYLDLFINYKLKVRAAEDLGMDTVSKFKSELAGYRTQLARPYLIDRGLNDQLMQEAFNRKKEEIRASHILVQVDPDASPEDTLAAWKRIEALRARVVGGEDFATVAKSKGGSDDPSAKTNGGDLGYFSVLQMVYPFENAAYNTPVGQVSRPVRTKFGYHIIKATDRRPAQGEVKVAHIMIRTTDEDSPEKQQEAEKKIEEAYGRIKSGELSFSDAAMKYSDDAATNTKGGELPPFTTGKMIPEFEEKAFALQSDGDLSTPFKTSYGWHIVKRLSYTPPPNFEEVKGELKTKIAHDSRAEITRKKFLADLRSEYHFKAFPKNQAAVEKALDTTVFRKGTMAMDTLLRKDAEETVVTHNGLKYDRTITGALKNGKMMSPLAKMEGKIPPMPDDTVVVRDVEQGWVNDKGHNAKLTKPVFTIDGKSYSQMDLLDYIQQKQRRGPVQPIGPYVKDHFDQFVDDQLLAFEDGNLEKKYPEFRMLMKEYRDGILLFELTDEKVWSKAVKDTAGLENYYEQHKFDFMYPVRYDLDIYTCANADVAKQVRGLVKKGKAGKDLLAIVNKKDPTALSIESGLFTKEEKPLIKDVTLPGLTTDVAADGKVLFADMKKVVQPEPKPLIEARGLVTAAYQDQLEKDWIKELRAKYPVKVEQDVLYSIK
ncbi:MAG: peptidylprolyl isomerase [Flavobacteriales bacterium]|jgi:peptidyl-prolyl cis-trans isomerase SurA|nr:peptidylprolyl isomerase [Flavobacteriales bacterium]QQS72075.1 MAG: peptidylprolyl isomerase [Flavobacteriales bacterium]HQV40263.1 peptidylprolyl isomerase [Flavobacteriales bacterium]HQW31005.1 peptidylprolyl isomerase [Flavobacteriales bacterium]HQY79322.1 peptidylprolyl isomerase [Flavobacteriales bacterium]